MKVLLVSNYAHDLQESMQRFVAVLADGLRAAGVEVQIAGPEPVFGRLKPAARGLGKWLGYLDKFVLFPRRLRRLAATADVVHVCDHSNAMYVRHIAERPHLVTCHDLLAVRSAHGEFARRRTGWSGRILQRWILNSLRAARRVACVSEATRRDFLRLTGRPPEAASVIPLGQNFPYAPVPEVAEAVERRRSSEYFNAAVFGRFQLPERPYLLHVGGAQWYKNRKGVVAIHEALRSRLGEQAPLLVLVGPPISAPNAETRSNVGNDALAALYSGAELLLFPSLEEGFGWPIIEAQACGCRVLTTDKDPMREVGGKAASYLPEPNDAAASASAVEAFLSQNAVERASQIRAGLANAARFSTENMIRGYLALYQELLAA